MAKNDKPTHEFVAHETQHADAGFVDLAMPVHLRSKTSIYVNDDSIRIGLNRYFADRNKHSGKLFFGWRPLRAETYFKTRDGRLLMINCQYKQNRNDYGGAVTQAISQHYFTHHPSLARISQNTDPFARVQLSSEQTAFNEAFDSVFGTRDVQPLRHLFGDERILSTFSDPRAVTAYLFGKSRVRKDLVKAVSIQDPATINHLTFAALFRDLVPLDWIITFLRNNAHTDNGLPNNDVMHALRRFGPHEFLPNSMAGRRLRKIILTIDPKNYRRILRADDTVGTQDVTDLFMQAPYVNFGLNADTWRRIAIGRIRSATELHNGMIETMNRRVYYAARGDHVHALARQDGFVGQDRFVGLERETFNPVVRDREDPLWQSLKDASIEEYKVVLPVHADNLNEWGEYMHNCIGSYRTYVNSPDRILGAVKRDDTVIANFEIVRGRLNQLLGRFNRPLPDSSRNVLEDAFKARGVDTSYYTGQVIR